MALNYNIGSVVNDVSKLIEDIPLTLSGTNMNSIVSKSEVFIENFTGQSVGSPTYTDKFVPILVDFTCADVLASMELVGTDTASIRIGDFSQTKGSQSNTSVSREYFLNRATSSLKSLMKGSKYFKANG